MRWFVGFMAVTVLVGLLAFVLARPVAASACSFNNGVDFYATAEDQHQGPLVAVICPDSGTGTANDPHWGDGLGLVKSGNNDLESFQLYQQAVGQTWCLSLYHGTNYSGTVHRYEVSNSRPANMHPDVPWPNQISSHTLKPQACP